MTHHYNPTENAIDAAIQRKIDAGDRYPTTRAVTCECGWRYSQTNGVPAECPMCVHKRGRAELDRVLRENSDLKGKAND